MTVRGIVRRLLLLAALAPSVVGTPSVAWASHIYSTKAEKALEALITPQSNCCAITRIYTASGAVSWTWPTVDGAAGTALITNGAGVLSFSGAAAVTGSGTTGTLAKFTGGTTLGNSILTESGTVLTVGGTLNATNFNGIIGATTPAPGTFTTGTFGGLVSISAGSAVTQAKFRGGGTDDMLRIATATAGNGATIDAANAAEVAYAPLSLIGSTIHLKPVNGNGFLVTPTAASLFIPLTIPAAANTVPLTISGYSVTGSGTSSLATYSGTLNTSGVVHVNDHVYTITAAGGGSTVLRFMGGAAGATTLFALTTAGAFTSAGLIGAGTDLRASAGGNIFWNGRAVMSSPADGHVKITDAAGSGHGMLSLGATTLTLTSGAFGMPKMTASGTAPGATGGKLEWVCGTNAGTLKIIAYAGTSTTPTTILDNIGSGVTGC